MKAKLFLVAIVCCIIAFGTAEMQKAKHDLACKEAGKTKGCIILEVEN